MEMEKTVLTLNELVEYTGLSKSYLYKLTHRNILPHSKPFGKKLFFEKAKIDRFLLSNPIATAEMLESKAATFVTLKKGVGK